MRFPVLVACSALAVAPALAADVTAISAPRILAHTRLRASDAFEGRAPATPGEDKTIADLAAEVARAQCRVLRPDTEPGKGYHKTSDDVKPDWTMLGAAHDTRFLLALGLHLANADAIPGWKPGTKFRARRDAMMATATP